MKDPIELIKAEIAAQINKQVLLDIAEKPTSKLINVDKVSLDEIKDWLRDKHVATWSIYSIHSEDSMEKAAKWFKEQLDSFVSHLYDDPRSGA